MGYSVSDITVREKGRQQSIQRLRHTVTEAIAAHFEDKSLGGIATSLLTGDRGAIDKDTISALYASGLGHLLSISGLHLAMVMAGFFFILRALLALWPYVTLRYPIKKWSAVFALIAGFAYLLLAGWPVPAQRSYIMAGLFFLAILFDRTGAPLRPVAWAALIVLMIAPESVLNPSFQMSFAAVIALIAAFDAIPLFRRSDKRGPVRWLMRHLLAIVLSSLIAGAATAPFAVHHFGRYSNYGLLANLLAIPLTSFWIMPWGMLALLLMPFGLESLALGPMQWGLTWLVKISTVIAALPHANILMPHVGAWVIGCFSLGGLWLAMWRTRLRLLGIPLVLASLLGILLPPLSPDVFIGEEGKLFAVKDRDGRLVFPSLMAGRYARSQWLEYVAQEDPVRMKESDVLQCDREKCIYTSSRLRGEAGGGHSSAPIPSQSSPASGRGPVVLLKQAETLQKYCSNFLPLEGEEDFVAERSEVTKSGGGPSDRPLTPTRNPADKLRGFPTPPLGGVKSPLVFINLAGDAPCPAARISITRADLAAKGTHLLWLDASPPRIVTAAGLQGNRLWTTNR